MRYLKQGTGKNKVLDKIVLERTFSTGESILMENIFASKSIAIKTFSLDKNFSWRKFC